MRHIFFLLPLLACGGDTDTDTDTPAGDPQWYLGCGDPVCQAYSGPFDGVPLCTDAGIDVGTPCDAVGETCDPVDACNALVQCTTSDPLQDPYGCPVSLARHKRDVRYLASEDRAGAARELNAMKLATWRYKGALDDGKTHLGFLIDDVPGSSVVAADGQHVDLYSYTSLAIATIQQQQQQIEALEARLEALEASCD